MTWFGFLILFGLSCVLFSCRGDVSLPSSGNKLILLPGSTGKIEWTFDDNITDVLYRAWTFTSTYDPRDTGTLSTINNNGYATKVTKLPSITVQKPATLVLKNVERRHDGVYKLSVVSQKSSTASEVTVIIVVTPTITFSCPNSSTVNEGDNFTCLCKADGGRPTANVTWYDKNGVQIGETGKGEQLLNLTNVNETHSGNYTCKAQSHINATDEKSIEINVRLNYKPKNTKLTIKPEKTKYGEKVIITCESDGLPEPSYAIFLNGSLVDDKMTYIIKNVNYTHNGTYKCVATNKLGNDSASANLTVVEKVKQPTTQPTTYTRSQLIKSSTALPTVPSVSKRVTIPTGKQGNTSNSTSGDSTTKTIIIVVVVTGSTGGFGGITIYYYKKKERGKRRNVDVNQGSRVITNTINHYELEEDQVESGENAYDTAKPPDKGEGSQKKEEKPPGDSLPPVYASVDKNNRPGNPLYASLDSEALNRPGSTKKQPETPKAPPTEYASIDFMKTAKTPNDDIVST